MKRLVALDEGRFGLITWLRRRWCPLGERPAWIVQDDYEWLWLSRVDERDINSVVPRPERHGNGHRTSLGLRRELVGKRLGSTVRMFIDGEVGANVALVNDNMTGVAFLPGALGGLRFGYDVYSRSDSSPSRTFEAEVLVRAIAIQHGAGALLGVGMFWGN